MTTAYHVTVLSNFARGYDKYSGTYSKAGIPESTFPDRFFLLAPDDIGIGVAKASPLLARLGLAGDRLIVLETRVAGDELRANTGTGLGCFVGRPYIQLTGVHALSDDGALVQWSVEDAMARSLRVLHPQLLAYDALAPRSVSLLPIAKGCQARCAFCFSHASISADQQAGRLDRDLAAAVLREGRRRGAERAVITGGGEPGMLPFARLLELVRACAASFPRKVVLISNGLFLAALGEGERRDALRALEDAGLTVLSLSRHHPDPAVNARIMALDVGTERVLASLAAAGLNRLQPRIITVLQRGGVEIGRDAGGAVRVGRRSRRRRADAQGALRRHQRGVRLPRPRRQPVVPRASGPAGAGDHVVRATRVATGRRAAVGRADSRGDDRRPARARRGLHRAKLVLGTQRRHRPQLERAGGRRLLRIAGGPRQPARARAAMNFQAYKTLARDILASERGRGLLRLDCMNPVKALAALKPRAAVAAAPGVGARPGGSLAGALGHAAAGGRVVLSTGVRPFLARLYAAFATEGRRLHAPEDVYPVYLDLAAAAGLTLTTSRRCPRPSSPRWARRAARRRC